MKHAYFAEPDRLKILRWLQTKAIPALQEKPASEIMADPSEYHRLLNTANWIVNSLVVSHAVDRNK